jgi:hypothetical protein
MSSKTARAPDEETSSTYTFTLRIKHPSFDPDEITSALGISPDHAWACGEPRRSEAGLTLGGARRNSYWSATLPLTSLRDLLQQWREVNQVQDPSLPPEIGSTSLSLSWHLTSQLMQLRRHRALFERLASEGGEVSLLCEVEPPGATTLVIEPSLARQIADLGLKVELQLE